VKICVIILYFFVEELNIGNMIALNHLKSQSHNRSMHLILLCWVAWLTFPVFCFGPESYLRLHDSGDGAIPILMTYLRSPWSLWASNIASGTDLISQGFWLEYSSFFLYLFPDWIALAALTIFQRWVAGYFMYRLLREPMQIKGSIALLSGLAYATFGFDMWQFGYSPANALTWAGIPAVIWALERIDNISGKRAWMFASLLGIAVSLSSYYILAVFIWPCVFLWFVLIRKKCAIRFYMLLGVTLFFWLLFEWPIIEHTYYQVHLSHRVARGHMMAGYWENHSSLFHQLWNNSLYELVFFIIGVIVWLRKRRQSPNLHRLMLTVITIMLCYRSYQLLVTHSSIVSDLTFGVDVTRVFTVLPFLGVAGGAMGLQELYANVAQQQGGGAVQRLKGLSWYSLGRGACILFMVGQTLVMHSATLVLQRVGYRVSEAYHRPEIEKLVYKNGDLFRVASAGAPPSLLFAYGLQTADGYLNLYSQTYHEYWKKVILPLRESNANEYDYFNHYGNRICLFLPKIDKTDYTLQGASINEFFDINLLSLSNVRYLISSVPLLSSELKLVAEDVDPYYNAMRNMKSKLNKIWTALQKGPLRRSVYIYENPNALDCIRVLYKTRTFSTDKALLEALSKAELKDFETYAYVLELDEARLSDESNPDKMPREEIDVKILSKSNGLQVVSVDHKKTGILTFSENYSPYWHVFIDGKEGKIFPVYHTYQGVILPPGSHKVTLCYSPPSFLGRVYSKCSKDKI